MTMAARCVFHATATGARRGLLILLRLVVPRLQTCAATVTGLCCYGYRPVLLRLQARHPPDHLTTLFMLGAAPEHLPPSMLPPSPGGGDGDGGDGGDGDGVRVGDGGGDGGDGGETPLHPELQLGGAWRGRRRHFSFRYVRSRSQGTYLHSM